MVRVAKVGKSLKSDLEKVPGVLSVRGEGLLIGIVLDSDIAPQVVSLGRENGILVNATGPRVIRIAPALTITDTQLREFLKKFALTMKSINEGQNV